MDSFLILLIGAIPGFLTVALVRLLILDEKKLSRFEFTIWSAICSLLIYLLVYCIAGSYDTFNKIDIIESLIYKNSGTPISSDLIVRIILLSLGLSIFLASLFSFILIRYELVNNTLKVFHGKEIIDDTVWDRTFKKLKDDMWTIVHTNSNEMYYGLVHRYSLKKEKRQLLLANPKKFNKEGKLKGLKNTDEILFFEEDIKRIEILKSEKNGSKENTKNTNNAS